MLDLPEIGPNHYSFWELGGHVDGPDSGSGTDVKNVLGVVADGCSVKVALKEHEHDLVV